MQDEDCHPDPTLLSKCLLVLDNVINDEKTIEVDIPLFFYPKETELRQKVQVIQSCLAISSLSISICDSKQTNVVSLKRVKLVYKQYGEYTMVLTGDIRDSNQALMHHIGLIWDCFMFYHGSFERFEQMSPTRADLQRNMMKAGEYLLPLLENFHSNIMKFSPMPYCKLADAYKNTSSYFVMGWQVTSALEFCPELENLIYGSCIIFKEKVVCTRLDVKSTRWIINFIEATKTEQDFSLAQKNIQFIGQQVIFPVYIPENVTKKKDQKIAFNLHCWPQIKQLMMIKYLYFNENNEKLPTSYRFFILSKISRYLLSLFVSDNERTEGNICLISLAGGLSVCLLANRNFVSEHIKHVKKVLERNSLLIHSLITTLETTTIQERKIQQRDVEPDSSDSERDRDANLFFGQPQRLTHTNSNDKREFFGMKPKSSHPSYFYFAYDSLTEMQTETGNTKGDAIFNAGVNWSRDIFSERENTNKLVLQNHAGVLLSKKYFGRESFFQGNVELEDIEIKAREYLGKSF